MKTTTFSTMTKSALLAAAFSALASAAGAASYDLTIISGGYSSHSIYGSSWGNWSGVLHVDVSDDFQWLSIDEGQGYREGNFKTLSLNWDEGSSTLYSTDGVTFTHDFYDIPIAMTSYRAVLNGQTSLEYQVSGSSQISSYSAVIIARVLTPGEVVPVPVPGAFWLFGSSLMALAARRISKRS